MIFAAHPHIPARRARFQVVVNHIFLAEIVACPCNFKSIRFAYAGRAAFGPHGTRGFRAIRQRAKSIRISGFNKSTFGNFNIVRRAIAQRNYSSKFARLFDVCGRRQ